MTAALLLADLCRHGASLAVNGERLRVEAPQGLLTAALCEALKEHKKEAMRLIRFAEKYRALLSDGPEDEASYRVAQARLVDELGPVLATVIRQAVERGVGPMTCVQRPAGEALAGPEVLGWPCPFGDARSSHDAFGGAPRSPWA